MGVGLAQLLSVRIRGGRSPGRHSGSGGIGGGPGSWGGSGSMRLMHGSGHSTTTCWEQDLLYIGWNMEKVMFDVVSSEFLCQNESVI